jgi:glc operon protein GlcG
MTLAACAIAAIGSPSSAQTTPAATPPAQPSAGGTPDAMPFDIPYGDQDAAICKVGAEAVK